MKRLITIAAALLLACTAGFAQKLVILHANDTHSHLDPLRDGSGGIIERAAFVDSVRRAEGRRHVLLLHAGDFNQGTSYYTVLKGGLEVDLVNALGYDAMCFGNHEFDNGIEDLTERVKRAKAHFVCCNYDFSPFELGRYVKPYTILRRGGLKVGVIGVLCDITKVVSRETADRIPKLDTVEEVNRWASYLKNDRKCDLVIALTHIGYASDNEIVDVQLAERVSNVDIIIGGHSHTPLKEMDTKHTGTDGKVVPVVTDYCWGLNWGVLKVY